MNQLKIKSGVLLILGLLIIGAFLRFYNLNWDQGHYFHPDERNIANAVSKIRFFSQLDPGFFAYGGFSIYLYRAGAEVAADVSKNAVWLSDWGHIDQVGRFFSALFSTLTIIPLFLLAKKLFGKSSALLTALLYVFSVASIQSAHFDTTESLLVFFAVLISLFSLDLLDKLSVGNLLKCALVLGLAVATKTTSLIFVVAPGAALAWTFFKQKNIFHLASSLAILAIVFLVTFTIFSPFTFLDWEKFNQSMGYESGVATGSLPVVYTLQFTHTASYFFQLENLLWQLGPIALVGILGVVLALIQAVKNRDKKILVALSIPLIYFAYVGSWHTKFIRYMMPTVPYLLLFASYYLLAIIQGLSSDRLFQKLKLNILGYILGGLFVGTTIIWGLAFFTIYTRPQTRISASQWIYQNIPAQAKLLGEEWDDGLPISLPDRNPGRYQIEQLKMYQTDDSEKIAYLADKLSTADYIIFNSRRLYGTLIHLPDQYPITSNYYQMLFENKLGYQKVAEFTSYPGLFGYQINDDSSEETFQVYDHPKVMIFQNTLHLNKEQYLSLLQPPGN
ncbi:MAG: glycosyltransferase family 39 protein [Patescibacteria group bacterium]|nr:glycosyltransferase family 39 protein [Patescibacteria group bacterium]